jgi:hypothetical protein
LATIYPGNKGEEEEEEEEEEEKTEGLSLETDCEERETEKGREAEEPDYRMPVS